MDNEKETKEIEEFLIDEDIIFEEEEIIEEIQKEEIQDKAQKDTPESIPENEQMKLYPYTVLCPQCKGNTIREKRDGEYILICLRGCKKVPRPIK